MLLFYLFSLLLCVYESHQKQEYNPDKYRVSNIEGIRKRLVVIMRSYYEEAHSRSQYMNPIRFMYEESPFYEMGYITSEIIERYRKVLSHTQISHRTKDMSLFQVIKRVEFVQKLYFEIYHLVRMQHETPRKWATVKEFANIEKVVGLDVGAGLSLVTEKENITETNFLATLEKQKEEMEKLKKIREEEKKKRKRQYEQQRNEMLKAKKRLDYNLTNIYNPVWPIDYGWEIQNNTW